MTTRPELQNDSHSQPSRKQERLPASSLRRGTVSGFRPIQNKSPFHLRPVNSGTRRAASFIDPLAVALRSSAGALENPDCEFACGPEHHDKIAKLNDTKGGQAKLLAQLEAEGDRVIRLLPIRKREQKPGKPKGQKDGSRSSRPAATGAKLRFAVAQLGGVAAS